jgi:hypothetical protein
MVIFTEIFLGMVICTEMPRHLRIGKHNSYMYWKIRMDMQRFHNVHLHAWRLMWLLGQYIQENIETKIHAQGHGMAYNL